MGIRHQFYLSITKLTYKTFGKLQRLYDIYKSHKQDTVTHKTNPTALGHLLNHIIPNLPKFTTHNYPSIPISTHLAKGEQGAALPQASLLKGRFGGIIYIIGTSRLFKPVLIKQQNKTTMHISPHQSLSLPISPEASKAQPCHKPLPS